MVRADLREVSANATVRLDRLMRLVRRRSMMR